MTRVTKRTAGGDQVRGIGTVSTNGSARLKWLLANPELWKDAPSDSQDVTDEGRGILASVGQQMVDLGLYARSTEATDRAWGLRILIGEARRRLK